MRPRLLKMSGLSASGFRIHERLSSVRHILQATVLFSPPQRSRINGLTLRTVSESQEQFHPKTMIKKRPIYLKDNSYIAPKSRDDFIIQMGEAFGIHILKYPTFAFTRQTRHPSRRRSAPRGGAEPWPPWPISI
jgi:hypothetical protein